MKEEPIRVDCEPLDAVLTVLRMRFGPRQAACADVRRIAERVYDLGDIWDGLEFPEGMGGEDHDD